MDHLFEFCKEYRIYNLIKVNKLTDTLCYNPLFINAIYVTVNNNGKLYYTVFWRLKNIKIFNSICAENVKICNQKKQI